MDDFECGTRPAGPDAVVLAPGRGFGHPGTGWRAWPGHFGRHGAVAGPPAGGRRGHPYCGPRGGGGRTVHGAGPLGEGLGQRGGYRCPWAGRQRQWQESLFSGALLSSAIPSKTASKLLTMACEAPACPRDTAGTARRFERLRGLVGARPLPTHEQADGPRSSTGRASPKSTRTGASAAELGDAGPSSDSLSLGI